jgi:CBS domain-containing protein
MSKLVRDLMHLGVMTCKPDLPIGQVAVMLTQNHIHSLIVVDRDGRPIGIITDFDLLAGEWLSADPESLEVMRSLTAGDLMSSPIAMVEASAPAKDAARRMRDEVIRRLLVVENGKPVGVISVSDFVASLAQQSPTGREKVSEVMSDAMLVCRENTPVWAAAKAMTQTNWRSVLVVNGDGKPLGVFSGLDLLSYCEGEDGCVDHIVTEVMHPALTIQMNASLREAADKMIANHHHRLVVIDPDRPEAMPLGIISSFNIVAEMARPGSVWQK